MASYTFYTTSATDGFIASTSATYSTARSGGGSFSVSTTDTQFDNAQEADPKSGIYTLDEGFIGFDTSAIATSETVTSATLSLWRQSAINTHTTEVYVQNWGTTLTSSSWVPGANISSLTLVASVANSGISTSSYTALTQNGTNLNASIQKGAGAASRYLVSLDTLRLGNAPSSSSIDGVGFFSAEAFSGTQAPQLAVTTTVASTASASLMGMMGVG